MPISRYLGEGAFGPDEIELLVGAFDQACQSLSLPDRDHPVRELLARAIVDLAATGERDPMNLHERAIESVLGRH
jgi:hypothetical protein